MTTGLVRIWPRAHCLVSQLADDLSRVPTEALPNYAVVLPTKRLCAWLIANISAQRGTCLLPRLLTWDDLIEQETSLTGEALPKNLWESLLVADFACGQTLVPGDEHEIAQLFSDLRKQGISEDPFPALLETVSDFAADDTLQERLRALSALWQKWQDAPFIDAEEFQNQKVAAICQEERRPWKKLYLIGLTSLQQRDLTLLASYLSDARTELWLPEASEEPEHAPMAKLTALAQSHGSVTREETLTGPPPVIFARACSSPVNEVVSALQDVKVAISQGIAPHEIGIALADEALYGPLLRSFVASLPGDKNLAVATPLAHTRVGTWLRCLIAHWQDPDDLARLESLWLHPVTRNAFGSSLREGPWSYSRLVQSLARKKDHPYSEAWQRASQSFASATERTLVGWWEHWVRFCEPFSVALQELAGQLDQTAAKTFLEATTHQYEGLKKASFLWPQLQEAKLSREVFLSLLERFHGSLNIRSTGDPFYGVQVLGIEELRFFPLRKVIILGAVEGFFPRSSPKDHLVDPKLKKLMGLPGWEEVEAIENTTFHLLAARLPDLTLSYPEEIQRRETVRSRFLETMIGEKRVRFLTDRSPLEGLWPEKPRPPKPDAPTDLRQALDATLQEPQSTGSVEDLVACPLRFALRKWRVSDSELLSLSDAKEEGEWLHQVLEVFFTGKVSDEEPDEEPLELPQEQDAFLLYCCERLERITQRLLPPAAQGSSLHLQLMTHSWARFSEHLWRLWQADMPKPSDSRFAKELDPGEGNAVTTKVGSYPLSLRLRIDSVDPFQEGIVVTDYKRRYTKKAADVATGAVPQLPLYAAALGATGYDLDHMLLGYFSILRGEWVPVLAGEKAAAHAISAGLMPKRAGTQRDLKQALAQIGELLEKRATQMAAHSVPLPDRSSCGLCSFAGICRKDDPRFEGQISQDLDTWLDGEDVPHD